MLTKRETAQKNLNWELKQVHADSPQHAEQLFGNRQSLLKSAQFAEHEYERLLASSEVHFESIQALELYVLELKTALETQKRELEIDELPTVEDAIRNAVRAEEESELKRQEYESLQNQLNEQQIPVHHLQNEITRVKTQYEQHKQRLYQYRNEFEKLESVTSLKSLEKQIENTKVELLHQKEVFQTFAAKHDPLSLDRLLQRMERIQRRIKQRRVQEQNLRESILRLKTKLESKEARGLDEKLAKTERDLEIFQAKKKTCDVNIEVLELLLSTLRDAEQQAKQQFMQPVLNRVNPYLRYLFPESEINIDEDLKVMDIVRAKEQEKYDQLSMGTQEQIAVLIRLALAELLADKGIPAIVVLDDALVYSDDRRMDLMFEILTAAAKKNQIIVLTCREKVFQGLTDSVLSLTAGDIEELRSA